MTYAAIEAEDFTRIYEVVGPNDPEADENGLRGPVFTVVTGDVHTAKGRAHCKFADDLLANLNTPPEER